MAILPIPTTRVSDYLARTRSVQQTQSDQLDLFRLQNQISTGRRIFKPSEDGASALRAITLQRSLERQGQLQVNLRSAQNALSSADTALSGDRGATNLITEIRAEALGVSNTINTQGERDTTRDNALATLESLINIANRQYQDSYLFSGSRELVEPYVYRGTYVEYRGDERNQQRRVDAGSLFDTNIPGDDVFGGLSDPVRGSVDLNPQLTADTLLTDLRGGAGITANGSIEIAYVPPATVIEAESVVVDLSGARTVGDVARLIEAGAPADADLRVSVTGDGLEIEVEPGSGTPGSVVIREVAAGETAAELGILSETPATNINGGELDPIVRLTSNLSDLLGTRATGRLELGGNDNDLILTASDVGADDRNNLTVDIVDGPLVGGLPSAVFADGSPPVLTVTVESGVSTAAQVAAAINAEGTFQASIDYRDADSAASAGAGVVTAVNETSVTDGGAGTPLDLASGLLITNGDDPFAIDTSGAETVEDLLNLLNQPENGLFAEINASQTGIDVRTRRSGADFSIGENGGNLATQLGIRTYTEDSKLEDFNRGKGVVLDPITSSNEFTITVTDEGVTTTYQVDLEGDPDDTTDDARTVQDVIDRIAAATGGAVQAELAAVGNGLTLSGTNPENTTTATAIGTVGLAGDTLQFEATATGFEGNQSFSFNITDTTGVTGRSVSVDGNTINIELGGTSVDTATLAAEIDAQLADFNVTSLGVAGAVTVPTLNTTGGLDLATSSGTVSLDGDTLQFDATTPGAAGNDSFTINVVDSGIGGRTVNFDGVTNTIDVDLGGTTVDTATLAGEIGAQLAGYTVVSTGTPATVTTQSTGVTTTGGQDLTAAIGTVDLDGNTLQFDAVTPGAAGNQSFTVQVIDDGAAGLSTSVNAGVITVNLGGTTPTPGSDVVAASIDAELADFTVTAVGAPGPVSTITGPTVTTAGGEGLSPEGADNITVSGDAAQRFGFFAQDADPPSASGTTVTSADVNTIEVDSVFNSLLRLADALSQGEDAVPDIGRAIERLDDDLDRTTVARGEIGARLRSLETLQVRLEDEEVELRSTLSIELDVDLTEAISEFTARQFSLQASLQTTANLLQLSILNFI